MTDDARAWPAPGGDRGDEGVTDAVPGPVDLGKPAHGPAAVTPADPWAPPADAAGTGPTPTVIGWAAPSVHDQQTVTSMPTPQPWAAPAYGTTDPFAPPPAHAGPPEAVPPPPVAPDGPGVVPYGYPGGYGPSPQPQGYYGWPGVGPVPSNGLGTAALILGIIAAAVFCLWPLAIVLGVLAVVFGAVGRAKATRQEATNPGQALAGLICGIAGIVLGVGFGVLMLTA
ncbi:DUF4190 domain-containing protein [Streptomyces sp. NPDC003717]|uniref:DUF4190 domain-containing protein n=1 Tax=Streptomyces sp. NPDC003717 TaxID=3154276 RepID=UPI0033B7AF19